MNLNIFRIFNVYCIFYYIISSSFKSYQSESNKNLKENVDDFIYKNKD